MICIKPKPTLPGRPICLGAAVAAVIGLLLSPYLQPAVAAPVAAEATVKAVVVYKLTKFVTWPDFVFSDADQLTICVGRSNPLKEAMKDLNGRSAQGRSIQVRVIDDESSLSPRCHVLLVNESESYLVREALRKASDFPILTVGEGRAFVEQGGIIGLQVDRGRIAFVINMQASQRAGIDISARLLQLATLVEGEEA